MLGRTANGLTWMFRYIERAENIARLIDAGLRMSLTRPGGTGGDWDGVLQSAGMQQAFLEEYEAVTDSDAIDFMLRSLNNPSSVLSCIEAARNNARMVRTALTRETWEATNEFWIELKQLLARKVRPQDMPGVIETIKRRAGLVRGAFHGTMLRNEIYNFSRIGTFIERADNTARILDVKYHVLLPEEEHVGGPLDYYQWTSILRSVSALTAYHWVYRETLKPWLIADLLILNDTLPRSLASCYSNLVRNLDQIGVAYGRQGPSQRHARGVRNRLEHSHMDDIFQHGVHEFIQEFISDNARLGEIITKQYLI